MIDDLYSFIDSCRDHYKKYDVATYIKNGIDDGLKEDILNIGGTNKVEKVHVF